MRPGSESERHYIPRHCGAVRLHYLRSRFGGFRGGASARAVPPVAVLLRAAGGSDDVPAAAATEIGQLGATAQASSDAIGSGYWQPAIFDPAVFLRPMAHEAIVYLAGREKKKEDGESRWTTVQNGVLLLVTHRIAGPVALRISGRGKR